MRDVTSNNYISYESSPYYPRQEKRSFAIPTRAIMRTEYILKLGHKSKLDLHFIATRHDL